MTCNLKTCPTFPIKIILAVSDNCAPAKAHIAASRVKRAVIIIVALSILTHCPLLQNITRDSALANVSAALLWLRHLCLSFISQDFELPGHTFRCFA